MIVLDSSAVVEWLLSLPHTHEVARLARALQTQIQGRRVTIDLIE